MSNIKFYKDNAGHKSAFRLNFGEQGSKDWNGTSILFCGYINPISKHAIMLVEFSKLPYFLTEFDYHNLWRNIQGFCQEITEEEFNQISNDKFKSIVSGS